VATIPSEPSSPLDQVDDHDNDGNHEEEMDETAADMAEEAEKPDRQPWAINVKCIDTTPFSRFSCLVTSDLYALISGKPACFNC